MATVDGHTIYEAANGPWIVGVLLANDTVATVKGDARYASEASAALEAIRQHRARPHMNFIAVPL